MSITRNMELRHLPLPKQLILSQILDRNRSWEKLMECIPKNLPDIQSETVNLNGVKRKYSTENIQ